ncbi:ABC transporter ATP-binding protein [Ferrovibrio sp.]|uniref:ABC transporter ATP-binding protein n=1 Tax=Ferrovibrio sp. TaxID=1917215 RepID=UPI001B590160|nr:ABC transporter ATP-binding protein [Ferrovibrio sp.]MBP7064820.1 ABC transporter ATP-binding protein [Ferrovibrio sp.]
MSNIMPALKITDLRKRFGGLPAVDGVNLTIPVGDRRLLLGPNGAGKTTLFNLITGDIAPSSGRVELFGEDITGAPSHRCAHRGLARTYQILTLFPNNTLRENVYLALLGLSPLRLNPFRSLKNRADYAERAEQVLQQVGLLALADRKLSETAYGEKRRLEIALALAQKPRLLLLDEPLAGLSREERGDVQALIRAIPSDITVVLIEHDMDIALSLASSITVMYYGQVIAEGDRASITAHPKVREVYFAD